MLPMKLSKLTRCKRLPGHAVGRDFVVGDLHGHRGLLEKALEQLAFDTARDRLLSVGDLVNRGPDSLGTLALIEEPWFHAVLGNHELMLLDHLGYYVSRVHAGRTFSRSGGSWVEDAASRHPRLLARLADKLAALPIAIHVESDIPFNVMHGDLHPVGSRQDRLFDADTISAHEADLLSTSRGNAGTLNRDDLETLAFARHEVRVSTQPIGRMPITYVGHSPMAQITVHRSYVYIDQRPSVRSAKRSSDSALTVLEHHRFACWLGGVTSARTKDPVERAWVLPALRAAIA
jgi:serine/threonine protein phosphatase 1